ILRQFAECIVRNMKAYISRLSDERGGRLFKVNENIDIPVAIDDPKFAFSREEMKELKTDTQQAVEILSDEYLFACPKSEMNKVIVNLGMKISKWQQKRKIEENHFNTSTQNSLLQIIRNSEKVIEYLLTQINKQRETYNRDVRIAAGEMTFDMLDQLSNTSIELQELRKARNSNEKKIKKKLIEEYENLISELVAEISQIRSRFIDYRIQTSNEVLLIMSETKKEELESFVRNPEIPQAIKATAEIALQNEKINFELQDENSQLKMTV
ncbi:hypothetical protein HK096_001018, partial [Nowakowskiella sp. JEL0078]